MNFYEKFDELMREEMATWPADKQAHFAASRALVVGVSAGCTTPTWQAYEVILGVLEVGLRREVGQVGLLERWPEYTEKLEELRDLIDYMDSLSQDDQLDHGDMAYNMLGALSGALKLLRAATITTK